MNGVELVIFYDLDVSGRIDHDPGDYYTPPYTDIDITNETIDVTQVTLDEYDIDFGHNKYKKYLNVFYNIFVHNTIKKTNNKYILNNNNTLLQTLNIYNINKKISKISNFIFNYINSIFIFH